MNTEDKFYLQSIEVLHAHTGLERESLRDLLTLGEKANPIIAKLAITRLDGLEPAYLDLVELIEEKEGK